MSHASDLLPGPLQLFVIAVFALMAIAAFVIAVWPRREDRAPRKTAGQSRLTRKRRTGMDVVEDLDWNWPEPSQPPETTISAAVDDHPGGGEPTAQLDMRGALDEPDTGDPTALMRAVKPPVPPRSLLPPEQAQDRHQIAAEPRTPLPGSNHPRETRAERRRRLEALALGEQAQREDHEREQRRQQAHREFWRDDDA
jgi:hypothetical protein